MRQLTDRGVGAKLNLGCGEDVREGFLNVDIRQAHPNVVIADLSRRPWPFADESAEVILMLDFLEHFPYRDTASILLECYRVLQPNGVVVIQVPDAYQTTRAMIQDGVWSCNRCGEVLYSPMTSCPKCKQSLDEVSEVAMRRFYGGQDYAGNFHHTCFTKRMLELKTRAAGFDVVQRGSHDSKAGDELHYEKNWTLHMTFQKGELW
jgi:predicted SAM-dependent methyltransferase